MELSAALGDALPRENEFWRRIRRAHIGAGPGLPETIRLAASCGVLVGAHLAPPAEGEGLRDSLLTQIAALSEVTIVSHVRLRSRLEEKTRDDDAMASTIVELVKELDPAMSIVAPHDSVLASFARARGVSVIREAHADRRYGPDGLLQGSGVEDSLLTSAEAVMQATMLARYGVVIAANGVLLPMEADTLCVQAGDDAAVERLQAIETAVALQILDVPSDRRT